MAKIYIDVRESYEYDMDHVEKAINIPLDQIMSLGLPDYISTTDEIVVYCRSGSRSEIARQALRRFGYSNVTNGINQRYIESN